MAKLRGAVIYLFTQWNYSPIPLYVCSFCMALIYSMLMVVLPWRIIALGGQDLAIGASCGLLMGVYIVSCVLIRPHMDRLGIKRLVVVSSFLTAVNCALLAVAPTVTFVLILVCTQAMITGAFWSPLTGWISGVHEGKVLNQRLALFSFGGSAGNIIGPFLGGPLLNTTQWLPFVVVSGLAMLMCVMASLVHKENAVVSSEANNSNIHLPSNLPSFRWIARVSLFVSWVGMGLLRAPLASLFKEMTSTTQEGTDLTSMVMGLSGGMQLVAFTLLGKTEKWHYHMGGLIGVQLFGVALLAGVGGSSSVMIVSSCAILSMIATSYTYSSHIYYTLSGGAGRSAGMAIHEIVLAMGFAFGSFGGGFVGQWLNLRWAYMIGAVAWLAGLIVQLLIYLRRKRNSPAYPSTDSPIH